MTRSAKGEEEEAGAVIGRRMGTTGEAVMKPAGVWMAKKEEQPEGQLLRRTMRGSGQGSAKASGGRGLEDGEGLSKTNGGREQKEGGLGEPQGGGCDSTVTVEREALGRDLIPGRPELVVKPGEDGPVSRRCRRTASSGLAPDVLPEEGGASV
jgi:hypothetical protein